MELDEAIKHCEEVAKEKHTRANKITSCGEFTIQAFDKELTSCRVCAEEHEQLAEWLKQLQEVKEVVNEYRGGYIFNAVTHDMYFKKILDIFKE